MHLQAGQEFESERIEQTTQIYKKLESLHTDNSTQMVCGDFNEDLRDKNSQMMKLLKSFKFKVKDSFLEMISVDKMRSCMQYQLNK